jgi:di/tricarboxylate transporter
MDNKAEVSTNSQISINSPNKKNIKSWQQIVFFLFIVIISTFVPLPILLKEKCGSAMLWAGGHSPYGLWKRSIGKNGFLGCLLLYSLGATNGWSTLKNSAFSGFSEPTVWFVFGGLIIGLATHKSGIGKSIAYLLFNRVGGNFQRILFGYILTLLAVTLYGSFE